MLCDLRELVTQALSSVWDVGTYMILDIYSFSIIQKVQTTRKKQDTSVNLCTLADVVSNVLLTS